MFENKTDKELIIIYIIIALLVTLALVAFHLLQGLPLYYIIIAANVEFFCIFYFLYLPIKYRKKE